VWAHRPEQPFPAFGRSFDRWANGLGFDYFYGFNAGDMNHWNPILYQNRDLVPASTDGGDTRPAPHAEGMDRRVQGQVRRWLGQVSRGDALARQKKLGVECGLKMSDTRVAS
jgi:hypothetical protein